MTDPALKNSIFERFDRYARIYTTSDETSDTVPSTARQFDLSRLLVSELHALGIDNAAMDDNGYVYASLDATAGCEEAPAIGFIAHVDTSPQVSGERVVPQRHSPYEGGEIVISNEPRLALSPATSPELAEHVGHEIITSSGDTLLGSDNKAGIAIIMTLAENLLRRETPHGPVKIAFSVDEEIGRGMDHFDVERFGAEFAYTIDGSVLGGIEYECFNADGVEIKVTGRSIHPAVAKNQMANAAIIAAELVAAWPDHLSPEHTEGREGFIMFSDIAADVESATIKGIVRDHDLDKLKGYEQLLEAIVAATRLRHPRAKIDLSFTEQYRNMRQIIDQHPEMIETLQRAFDKHELPMRIEPIRGGTDGSRLSFMGIPTPNIFTGGANFHSRDEWVSLDSMAICVALLQTLLEEWTASK